MDVRVDEVVQPLHRVSELGGVRRVDLRGLSSERAATALLARFAETGYAEALVADPEAIRGLARRDCRRRRLKVRTLSVGHAVVLLDEPRYEAWLRTEEGQAHRDAWATEMSRPVRDLVNPRLPGPPGS